MKKIFILSFLSAFFSYGQQITWLDTISNYNLYNSGTGLSSDMQGNLHFTGGFGYTSNNGRPTGIFIHEYSSQGILLGFDTIACPYNTNIMRGGTCVDSQDNFYIAIRSFSRFKYKNVIFDPQTWLIRCNAQGQVTGSVTLSFAMPLSLIVDNLDNVYVSTVAYGGGGSAVSKYNPFMQLTTSYPTGGNIAVDGSCNLYIMTTELKKYNSSGQGLWTYSNIPTNSKLTVDPNGDCYVISQGTYITPSTFQKISTQGNSLWTFNLTIDASYAITNIGGGIYLAGIQCSNQTPLGVELRKYDPNGNLVLSSSFPSPMGSSFVTPSCLVANAFGLYMGANYSQPTSGFLLKMSDPILTGLTPKKPSPVSNLNISPNPSSCIFNITYTSEDQSSIKLSVFDPLGKLVYTKEIKDFNGELKEQVNLTGFSKGVYILQLNSDDFKQTRRLVVE